MIDYELARQLKEAGFPQEPFWQVDVNAWGGSWYYFFVPDGCPPMAFLAPDGYKIATGEHGYGHPIVKIHTLSELIAQVHDISLAMPHWGRIFNLEGHWLHDFGYKANLAVVVNIEPGEEKVWEEWGQTPEEAVSLLWLSIQKK